MTDPHTPRIASGPEDLLPPAEIVAMSGLDYLHGLIDGRHPLPPLAGVVGYRLVRAEPGEVAIRATPTNRHLNPMGTVHGGWYGAILDSALGCAVMTAMPAGRWYTTLEYKVNLTRALPVGTEVEAVATLRHAGRTTGVADAVLRAVATGRIHATGSTTCLIMDA